MEDAKDRIKQVMLGLESTSYGAWQAWQLLLTSGGTEANNLALQGLVPADAAVFVGATEHPSVLAPTLLSPLVAPRAREIPIDPHTLQPNIDVLEQWLIECSASQRSALVSLMLGNNETGLITDLEPISRLCRAHRAVLHSDIVQALGKCDPSTYLPFVDAVTFSAHKLNGPVGVGALLFRSNLKLQPMLFGGGQQLELRPGTNP